MHNAIKFILAMLAAACVFYLLVLTVKLYAWIAIPFIIPAIAMIWKKDRMIGISVLTAFILALIAIAILTYTGTNMKISF